MTGQGLCKGNDVDILQYKQVRIMNGKQGILAFQTHNPQFPYNTNFVTLSALLIWALSIMGNINQIQVRFCNKTCINYIKITMHHHATILGAWDSQHFLWISLQVGENVKNASEEFIFVNLPNGIYWQAAGKVTWSTEERKI